MALIALEGMEFYAYHGYYEEEQTIGNDYILDVYLNASVSRAAMLDDLSATINYETVYFICKSEMRKPAQLLEHVVQRIMERLQYQFSEQLQSVRIKLTKLNPPLGGKVRAASVELSQ